jgi:polyhydroxybutyrate depolymerase
MQKILSILFLSLIFIACSKKDTSPVMETSKPSEQKTITLTVDGLTREYTIFLPTGYNIATTAMPLLFAIHGGGGTSAGAISLASFNTLAETNKFIVVYPQGIGNNWNDGRPTVPNQQGVDDVNFFRTMINTLSTMYKIDAKKIFATGISNGGFMSSRLGAELGDKIAAFASVAASVEKTTVYNNITGTNKVSAMYIQGTLDPLVPFLGGIMTAGSGGTIASHTEAISKWIVANNCSTNAVVTNMPDAVADGTTATRRDYNGGTNSTAVTSIIILGGGHTWPQGLQYISEAIIGKTCQDFNGSETIWEFFKTHPKL